MTPTIISYSTLSVTSRRAGANIRLLVAALVVGIRHTPNAPPDSDREGVPWGTSDATDKSINYTNFLLHHITAGYLRRQEEKNLRKTARELASLDPNNNYLLKIDIIPHKTPRDARP